MRVFLVGLLAAFGVHVQAGYYYPSSTTLQQPNAHPSYYPNHYSAQPISYASQQQYPSNINTYTIAPGGNYNNPAQYTAGQYQQHQTGFAPVTNQQQYPSNINTYSIVLGGNYNNPAQYTAGQYQQHQTGFASVTNQQQYPSNISTYSVSHDNYNDPAQNTAGQYQQYQTGFAPVTNQQQYPSNINTYSVTHDNYNDPAQNTVGQYQQYQSGFVPVTKQQNNDYEVNYSSGKNAYKGGSSSASVNLVSTQNQQISDNGNGGGLSQVYHPGYESEAAASPAFQAPATPVVTKHIYFHAPPPEIEEATPRIIPSTPRKKVYNIVFIKVPSQEASRSGVIQAATAAQRAPVEDKTLIYLLVKKPEPHPVLPPAPVSSQHEVFYVKYKGDVNEVAGRINGELGQQTLSGSPSPVQLQSNFQDVEVQGTSSSTLGELQHPLTHTLQPGLTNGQL